MGCRSSRPSKRHKDRPIYSFPQDDSPQLKNSLKKPGSVKKNVSVSFASDDEIFNIEVIKQDNFEKPMHSNTNKHDDEVDKMKPENKEAEQGKVGLEKVCDFVEVEENKSIPQHTSTVPPSQLQEDSQVTNVNSLPVTSAKSKELIVVKQKLDETETEIIHKEEQIRKLIGENERLKKEATRLKPRKGSQDPFQRLKSNQSTLREKIQELKKGSHSFSTEGSGSPTRLLESPNGVIATSSGTSKRTGVCNEPLSFRNGVAEANMRVTNTGREKEKLANKDWEITEFMVL